MKKRLVAFVSESGRLTLIFLVMVGGVVAVLFFFFFFLVFFVVNEVNKTKRGG